MELTSAFLADAATLSEGKLYVHGGGWDSINTTTFPTTHPTMAVALILEISWLETQQPHRLDIGLFDEDNNPMGVGVAANFAVAPAPGKAHGAQGIQPLAIQLPMITFPKPGQYAFRITVDNVEIGRIPFSVLQAMLPPLPPGAGPAGVPGL